MGINVLDAYDHGAGGFDRARVSVWQERVDEAARRASLKEGPDSYVIECRQGEHPEVAIALARYSDPNTWHVFVDGRVIKTLTARPAALDNDFYEPKS